MLRRKLLIVPLGILLICLAFFAVDGVLRLTLPDQPTVSFSQSTSSANHDRLIVFLPGAQASGSTMVVELLPVFRTYGDTMVVDYNPQRFNVTKVVEAVLQRAPPYRHITLIGASMGGMVASDIIHALPPNKRVDLILVDAPTGAGDLFQGNLTGIVGDIPFGPMSNHLLARTVWKFVFHPADLSTIHPRGLKDLHALWASYANYPLSGYADQLAYIAHHPTLTPLRNVRAVYVKSTRDTVVRQTAYNQWQPFIIGRFPLIRIDSTHISFLDEPDRWEAAFKQAFADLQ